MPANWLYMDSKFPDFNGDISTEEKLNQLQNYLYMLVEQMRYTTQNLDTTNMNQAAANGKTINDVIHPGDVLKVPGSGTTSKPSTGGGSAQKTYTVKAGDSWWLIAEKQMGSGSKMNELASANGKTINDVIHPGDVLKIPG